MTDFEHLSNTKWHIQLQEQNKYEFNSNGTLGM